MKNFFKYMFASMLGVFVSGIVLILLFFLFITIMISASIAEEEVKIKSNSVLHITLDHQIGDRDIKNPFDNLDFFGVGMKSRTGLNKILENIEKAGKDENIKGIYLDLMYIPAGIATVEEIRNALIEFKESGKFIYSYSNTYTQKAYYLASVSDSIFLNPRGDLDFRGLSAEIMFYKGALEKLGIEAQVVRHGKFKSFVEPYIMEKMSDENRQQSITYIGSIWNTILQGIEKSRNISVEKLNQIADSFYIRAPDDALKYKLIDGVCYEDSVINLLKKHTEVKKNKNLKLVTLDKYEKVPKIREEGQKGLAKDKIAIVYASGSIRLGDEAEENVGSDAFVKAIKKAREDKNVKAVVLRVNSPGGNHLASDIIWRELKLTAKEKPLVASLGDVAASGGYYLASAADTIIANPNTITGSIGVFGIIPNFKKLLNEKLGITIDQVKTNHYSDIISITRPMTAGERRIMTRKIENIYDVFLTIVAEGRNMDKKQVDSIGQGKIWSGQNAKEIGLIDDFGGLKKAIETAAQLAGLDYYRTVELPKQKDPLETIMEGFIGTRSSNLLEDKLGNNYKYIKLLEEMSNMNGVQARLPYVVEIK